MNEEEGANFIFIHSSINEIGVSSESEFQTMNSIGYFSKVRCLFTLDIRASKNWTYFTTTKISKRRKSN